MVVVAAMVLRLVVLMVVMLTGPTPELRLGSPSPARLRSRRGLGLALSAAQIREKATWKLHTYSGAQRLV